MPPPATAPELPTPLQHERTQRQVAEALAVLAASPRDADLAAWLKTWYLRSTGCPRELQRVHRTAQYLTQAIHRPRPFLA
ncbi:hypothetical protein [Deinococcus aquatilis]|uniref:hypothetical protein n=1 Tax=Deinococcus aquatilis TaxID=519440 RepID=UPI0012FA96C9|nr:hypothetical protein [Deinococcus aquatilis]